MHGEESPFPILFSKSTMRTILSWKQESKTRWCFRDGVQREGMDSPLPANFP